MPEHSSSHPQRDTALQTLLERSVDQLFSPLEHFIRKQTSAALLLAIATVIALLLANLPIANPISHIAEMEFGFSFEQSHYTMAVSEWINSGLMALFFFIIGLEIKRSILAGKLNQPRYVTLIIFAAIGGMLVPGLLYALINYDGEGVHGWAIPMATDTAFAVGVLALMARRISASISIFLAALAIFDDIGAILVIAIFYTEQLHYASLFLALIPLALLIGANRMGITNGFVFAFLGIVLWFYIHASGVHATVAGLLIAFTVPVKTYLNQDSFVDKIRGLIDSFESNKDRTHATMLSSQKQHNLTEDMHKHLKVVSTPLQRWELIFLNPVSIIILPLFALFNAGIVLSQDNVTFALASPVMWGIMAGLFIGKPLGIFLFCYIGLRLNLGKLPEGISLKDVFGVGVVAGIGFTMSVFITNLAFYAHPELVGVAKLGILLASFLSACAALLWLFVCSLRTERLY